MLLIGAVLVGGGYLAGRPAAPRASAPARAEAPSAATATATSTAGATDPGPVAADVSVDGRVPRIANEADLDRYLGELESGARARGTVDDELARAIAATKQASPVIGAQRASLKFHAFGDRLYRLRRQQQLAPTFAQLDSLAEQIRSEKDPTARAKLSGAYVTASAQLPPVERIEAMDRFKTLRL
jgi:hypothetical protein